MYMSKNNQLVAHKLMHGRVCGRGLADNKYGDRALTFINWEGTCNMACVRDVVHVHLVHEDEPIPKEGRFVASYSILGVCACRWVIGTWTMAWTMDPL